MLVQYNDSLKTWNRISLTRQPDGQIFKQTRTKLGISAKADRSKKQTSSEVAVTRQVEMPWDSCIVQTSTISDESIHRGQVCVHIHSITRTLKIPMFMSTEDGRIPATEIYSARKIPEDRIWLPTMGLNGHKNKQLIKTVTPELQMIKSSRSSSRGNGSRRGGRGEGEENKMKQKKQKKKNSKMSSPWVEGVNCFHWLMIRGLRPSTPCRWSHRQSMISGKHTERIEPDRKSSGQTKITK